MKMNKKFVDGAMTVLGLTSVGIALASTVLGSKQAKLQRQEDKAEIVKEVLAEINKGAQ